MLSCDTQALSWVHCRGYTVKCMWRQNNVFNCLQKIDRHLAVRMSFGSEFHMFGAVTLNVRFTTSVRIFGTKRCRASEVGWCGLNGTFSTGLAVVVYSFGISINTKSIATNQTSNTKNVNKKQ